MSQLGDLQKAIPCAHTYLQKNPDDPEMRRVMKEYKDQYDLSSYLIDHEEQPYEVSSGASIIHQTYNTASFLPSFLQHLFQACFLSGMKLLNSGNYSGGVLLLEETLKLYLHEHDLCQSDCEGVVQLLPDADFSTALSGWCGEYHPEQKGFRSSATFSAWNMKYRNLKDSIRVFSIFPQMPTSAY